MKIMSLFRRPAVRIALAVALALALPAVAMLFTDEVRWGAGDFALAGSLLAIIGATVELVVKNTGATYSPLLPSARSAWRRCSSARPTTHPGSCSSASCS